MAVHTPHMIWASHNILMTSFWSHSWSPSRCSLGVKLPKDALNMPLSSMSPIFGSEMSKNPFPSPLPANTVGQDCLNLLGRKIECYGLVRDLSISTPPTSFET